MDLPLKFTVEESRGVRRYITTPLTKEEYSAYKDAGGKYEGLRAIQSFLFPGEDPELIYTDIYLNCVYSDEYNVGVIGEGEEVITYIIFPESNYYNISFLPINTRVILDHIAEMLTVDIPDPAMHN